MLWIQEVNGQITAAHLAEETEKCQIPGTLQAYHLSWKWEWEEREV